MSVAHNSICRRKLYNDDFCFCPECTEIQKRIIAEQLKNREGEPNKIRQLERSHLKEKRNNIYIAFENVNQFWDMVQVNQVKKMYRMGKSLEYMSNMFKRDPDEVAILIMSLAKEGQIKPLYEWDEFKIRPIKR